MTWQLINQSHSRIVVPFLEIADRFRSRLAGLQMKKDLPAGHGLMLVPCSSVHTFFMRFDLDLIFLDKTGKVLALHRGVKPWRLAPLVAQTHAVIEVKAGQDMPVTAGDMLRVNPAPAREAPASLAFLLKP